MSTPMTANELAGNALEMLAEAQPALAEGRALEALKVEPDHLGALGVLGHALHAQERYTDAVKVYLRMTELDPAQPLHWMNVGTARRCAAEIDEALYAFARAAQMGAASADFFYNVALAHMARDDYESAASLLRKALALDPGDGEIRYRYALCCYETLRSEEALAALEGWEEVPPVSADVSAHAGELLMKLGQTERAEPAVRRAAAGEDPQARLTLIQVLERTNRTAEARRLLDELSLDPGGARLGDDLILMQAQMAYREANFPLAVRLWRDVLTRVPEFRNRHFQEFSLAKALDSLGQFDAAYRTLEDAHRSQAAYLELTAPAVSRRGAPVLAITELSCESADIAGWKDLDTPTAAASPIFIVAFPRSGTTLLELALDAHPMLRSMDEQPFLHDALDDMLGSGVAYPAGLAALTAGQLHDIRHGYWERARAKVKLPPDCRLIDKNPLNLLRLPVIKRLFPHAKILLCIRHPCDVLLSCYMQHFRAPDFALLCKDLGTLCGGYRKAFDFWYAQQALLHADVLELRYEQVVENFGTSLHEILTFLEVPWNDLVLAPAERAQQKRFISTPSYSQVIEPVNRNAVGRWHAYRRYFEPSLPLLQPYLDRWGYAA